LQYLSPFLDRLQTILPTARNRPSLFVAVGPPAFTSLSFALLAEQSLRLFPATTTLVSTAKDTISGVALYHALLVAALALWGLAAWLFMIAFTANISKVRMGAVDVQMFALIFPNVGFALASVQISRLMGNPKTLDVAAEVLALGVVVTWACVVVVVGYGVLSGRIFRG
jgi:tellurite resistance protein TehA-like permease